MTWEAIGAIGQMLSAGALFFVLAQVRQARRDSRRALSQGRAEALRELAALQLDAETIRTTAKASAPLGGKVSPFIGALMDQAGLTFDEAIRMMWIASAVWDYQVQTIANVDELPPIERVQFDGGIRRMYGNPGVYRLYYETQAKPFAHPDAIRYVENVLAPA